MDVFTLLDGKPYERFAGNATKFLLGPGLEVRCLSISDLIELIDLKKGTKRKKDQLDVTALRRLQEGMPPDPNPTICLEADSSNQPS